MKQIKYLLLLLSFCAFTAELTAEKEESDNMKIIGALIKKSIEDPRYRNASGCYVENNPYRNYTGAHSNTQLMLDFIKGFTFENQGYGVLKLTHNLNVKGIRYVVTSKKSNNPITMTCYLESPLDLNKI